MNPPNQPVGGTDLNAGRVASARRGVGRRTTALLLAALAGAALARSAASLILIGIESLEQPRERIAVRQIAGVIARRIVSWVEASDTIARGQRLGLIHDPITTDTIQPSARNWS